MFLILLLSFLTFQTCQQFTPYSSSFETNSFVDSDGWQIVNGLSVNIYNQCGTDRIFGGISTFGYMTLISKFFSLPPHSKIQVQLDFWKISNWQNDETIYLHLDGLRVIEQTVASLPTGSNICGGNDYVLFMDWTIEHSFETLQVIVAANIAFSSSIQGFWGIKNFRLFIQKCPVGCLICQESDLRFDCLKWTLYASSLTETISQFFNHEGWNVQNGQSQQSLDCLTIPMICGPNLCGINSIIQYQLILPPHYKLKIRFRFYYIDSWDSEHAYLKLNDKVVFDKEFKYLQSLKNYSLCGQTRFNDLSDVEDIEVSHSEQLATFQYSNNLDQSLDDESFGIRDFRIYLYCQFGDSSSQQCSQYCGDQIVQQTEECDDGNSIPFDGCHNCQYECCEGCSNCIKGQCQECYEEWEYQEVQRQCIWLGLEQSKNLQNVCNNSVDCVGQQNQIWQQECSLNCKLCYQNICLECQVGYNLLVGECQEICGVSEISMFQYPNCFCDLNCQLCNLGLCQQCIDTFTLFNNQCLVICGDGLVTIGLEECDDKNDIPYDGCYQCTYQCSEQCSDCQQGVCKDDCKNGLPKVNGICQSICGNLIIEDNEQCDDGNSIQYDGCYFCDYSCPQYCSICEQGRCYECNQNYYYDESQYSCYSVCGDGILTQETEQCDDSNVNSGDGCSNLCQVEEDWICPNNEACIYEKYPEFYAKYYSQKNQYQYVQLEFSQQLKRESDISIEYANFINATILQMDQSKYQISIISVSNATTTLSWISYAIEIYIDQELNDPPYLNIQLLENLYNEYGIKLRNSNKIIQIKIPNYLSKQDILISQNLLEYSEKVVYSLGALAGLLLLGGNGLAFWIALEILQEQSYFKFLNIEYPQNLMIYFESPGFSLGSIYQYFNVEQLPSIYQFRYFESKEKFQFYQINANIIDNMRSLVLSVFILIAVYILTYCAEKFLIVLEKFRQCESNEFITRMFQNLKFRVIKNKYLIRRDGINKIFSINCWDIFFMVFLQLSVYQFEKFLTNQIIALIILFASLLYITLFFKAKSQLQNPEKYLRQRLELYLILKKLLVMYSLVMFQSNYILQLLLICLTNSLYLVSWIFLKSLINIYEYYQTLILQGTLLIFILTTPIYWDLEICKFSYITKLIFGWFHISIFVFVVVFFLIVDAIISLQKFIRLINKYLQIQNDQEKQNSYQKDGPVKFTII